VDAAEDDATMLFLHRTQTLNQRAEAEGIQGVHMAHVDDDLGVLRRPVEEVFTEKLDDRLLTGDEFSVGTK
jgi:hypothetical protein